MSATKKPLASAPACTRLMGSRSSAQPVPASASAPAKRPRVTRPKNDESMVCSSPAAGEHKAPPRPRIGAPPPSLRRAHAGVELGAALRQTGDLRRARLGRVDAELLAAKVGDVDVDRPALFFLGALLGPLT